jgi:glycopeptide antibiotics resistance protein
MITVTKSIIYATYLLVLGYLVFIGGDDSRRLHFLAFDYHIQYLPFTQKVEFIKSGGIWQDKNFFFFLKEFFGNLILFAPFSILLMLGEGYMNKRKIVLMAFCASLSIEIIQLLTGLGHTDLDDLILNTLGAYVGIWVAQWIQRRKFWPSAKLLLSLPENLGWKQLKHQFKKLQRQTEKNTENQVA